MRSKASEAGTPSVALPLRIALCLAALLLFAGLCVLLYSIDFSAGGRFLPCLLFFLTGLYCPGCGSARAANRLLHLDFTGALAANPMAALLLPLILLYLLALLYSFLRHGRDRVTPLLPQKPLWFVFGLLLLFGVVRNLPLPLFDLLRPH